MNTQKFAQIKAYIIQIQNQGFVSAGYKLFKSFYVGKYL